MGGWGPGWVGSWVGGFAGEASVLNVQKGEKRDTNDLLGCCHSALQGKAATVRGTCQMTQENNCNCNFFFFFSQIFLNQSFVSEPLPDTDVTISLPSALDGYLTPGKGNKMRIQFHFYGSQKLFQVQKRSLAFNNVWESPEEKQQPDICV